MRRLLLFFLALSSWAQTPNVTSISLDSVGSDSFRLSISASASFTGIRVAYSIAPADCRLPNSSGNPVFYDQNLYDGPTVSNSGWKHIDVAGKSPDTTYNVCPQVTANNSTWSGTQTIQVHTQSGPANKIATPQRAAKVNTDYPADFITRTNIHPYPQAVGCPSLQTDFRNAVKYLATENAEITIPAGKASGCTLNSLTLDYGSLLPSDVITVPSGNVNGDGSLTIPGTSYLLDQAIILTPNTDHPPIGIISESNLGSTGGYDGRLYYLAPKSGATATYWVYTAKPGKGGKLLILRPNGSGSFYATPYPRTTLKNIFIRTSTPDSQFAAPGTALGGLQWAAKMGWLIKPASSRSSYNSGGAQYSGNGMLALGNLITHVRFVGIAFTTEDPSDAYTTPDPRAWRWWLSLPPTTQEILIDRCAFFTASLQQRVYDGLYLNGINSGVINSYFDKTVTYFHAMNQGGGVAASGNHAITVAAGTFTAGTVQNVTASTITVTLSGTPTSGAAQRFTVGMPMTVSSVLQVSVPPGITGSCTGGTCNFVTQSTPGAPTSAACNVTNSSPSEWPLDGNGAVGVKMVGCGDINSDGTLTNIQGAQSWYSPNSYGGQEGCQCVQLAFGPGPIIWRNNDTFMGGLEWHASDDAYDNGYKSDFWIYRNRTNAYWGGLWHWNNPDSDGNEYGLRPHKFEVKGGRRFTFEGNTISNYDGWSSAQVSVAIALRNEFQGSQDIILEGNIFQHVAGGVLLSDLNLDYLHYGIQGPPGGNILVKNNISWDVNEKGPDPGHSRNDQGWIAGTGSYASQWTDNTARGWWDYAGGMRGNVSYVNNTFPDLRGSIPGLMVGPDNKTGGVVWRNNFLSVNRGGSMHTIVIRPGGTGPSDCQGTPSDYVYFTCANPGGDFSGNILLSTTLLASDLNGSGFQTANIIPGSTAGYTSYSLSDKTTIWPNYVVKDWHYNLDPEMYRLPANSPFAGKGADITVVEDKLGYLNNPAAGFDGSNNLLVSWLWADENQQACVVDVGAPGQLYSTFTRFALDSGSSNRSHKITIPAATFTSGTTYQVAIRCETGSRFLNVKAN